MAIAWTAMSRCVTVRVQVRVTVGRASTPAAARAGHREGLVEPDEFTLFLSLSVSVPTRVMIPLSCPQAAEATPSGCARDWHPLMTRTTVTMMAGCHRSQCVTVVTVTVTSGKGDVGVTSHSSLTT